MNKEITKENKKDKMKEEKKLINKIFKLMEKLNFECR